MPRWRGGSRSVESVASGGSPYVGLETNLRDVGISLEMAGQLVARNVKGALAEAVLIIRHGIEENFHSQGVHFNEPWQELAAKTLENKARKGNASNPSLVDFGNLERNLTDVEHMSIEPIDTVIHVGTDDWRAHFHQGGTSKMPARKIIGVAPRDAAEIYLLFERAVDAALVESARI
jgi:phage gpG-like protein